MPRPSEFSQEKADAICLRMENGDSLRTICKDEEFPHRNTVFRWLDANESFRSQYARAREALADYYAEENIDISDDGTNDWMERRSEAEKGAGVSTGWVLNGENVNRSRLRIDARKWYASKLAPKKYGDKLDTTISGPDGGPVQIQAVEVTLIDPQIKA